MRSASTVVLVLLTAAFAAAAPGDFYEPADAEAAARQEVDEILLKDGTLLQGTIVEEREDVVVIETASLGRVEVPRANIERLASAGERGGAVADPDYNSIMFCPTPATLPKGTGYFRDFELFFLNFGYAPTDDFNISLGTLFPVTTEVLMLSLGAKLQLFDREEGPLGLALIGSYTSLEDVKFGSAGAVFGVGDRTRSLNLTISRNFDDDGDAETIAMIGADLQGMGRSKIIVEYMTSETLFAEDADDLESFLNFGLRFFGQDHSFSLTAFRPLTNDGDGFIGFPMIMYSKHW